MPPFPTFAHLALTVSDLDRSVAWYSALFAKPPTVVTTMLAGSPDEYRAAIWVDYELGLHNFPDSPAVRFDERRPGLDHVAFGCATAAELEQWSAHLDTLGIEHGEPLREWYGTGLAFRDPDGIQLELYAPRTA